MKYSTVATALGAFTTTVQAHYAFGRLLVNGTASGDWQYIRKSPYGNRVDPLFITTEPDNDVRCSFDVTDGVGTETATVLAGDEIGFGVSESLYKDDERKRLIYHDGPGRAYMSRAPDDDIEVYLGDGDWFKFGRQYGVKNTTNWELDSWNTNDEWMNFTIPETTPPGYYLIRAEHNNLSQDGEGTQFFIGCAHVQIIGPGGGTPGPMIKLPEEYNKIAGEGIGWDFPPKWASYPTNSNVRPDLTDYVQPGPPVWEG